MLFTDACISTVADLVAYESEVQEVAGISGLDLDTKLERAQTELGIELLATAVPLTGADTAGASFRLEQVVVTDALKLWHTFHTLSIVYRDAYNRKINDKYLLKWNEYRSLAKWAANLYFNLGVGLVRIPIPMPRKPVVDSVAGGALEECTYFVRTTWKEATGAESAPSPTVAYTVPAGSLLRVDAGFLSPLCADTWVPYVGIVAGEESRQEEPGCQLDEKWIMPPTGLVNGAAVAAGQPPDFYRQIARTLQRG